MYQKQKFQYQLTKKDKRWHSWVLFFLRAKCFHLLKMKAVTCHKTLCAQAPRCQQHLTAPPSWAENLGNLDECSLSSWRTFFFFLPLCCWICSLHCSMLISETLYQGHRILYENDEVRGQEHKSPSCREFNQEWVGRAGDRKKKILQLDLKALRTILYQLKSKAKPGKRGEL